MLFKDTGLDGMTMGEYIEIRKELKTELKTPPTLRGQGQK